MATSKDLLHVDPEKEFSPFVIKKNKKSQLQVSMQPPKITKLETSSVLSRVKHFIPMLASANQKLEKDINEESADKFDIENIEEDEKFIEMNIGIFAKEDKDTASSSSEGSDSESSEEDHICQMIGEVTEDNIKLTKEHKQVPHLIMEIDPTETTTNKQMDKQTISPRKIQKYSKQKNLRSRKKRNGKLF